MRYDFDNLPERVGTICAKWDSALKDMTHAEPLGMGIADMDFPAPKEVIDALIKRVKHGVFGYGCKDPSYLDAVCGWFLRRFDLTIQPEWVIETSGVVSSFHWCVRALTQEGDGVVVQPPVYGPILSQPEYAGRKVIKNHLVRSASGAWNMDFDALDVQLADAKAMIICSPHNPIGRVWKASELRRVVELCAKHNVILISDEIHCDLVLPEYKFTPIFALNETAQAISVMCTAPSKTFNIPGLGISNVMIANPELRATYRAYLDAHGLHSCNVLGETALKAAYQSCDDWVDAVMCTVAKNYTVMASFIAEHCPRIGVSPLEGTYLAWLDLRDILLTEPEIRDFFERDAGIVGAPGSFFEAPGFYRLNIATSPARITLALKRIQAAYKGLFEA